MLSRVQAAASPATEGFEAVLSGDYFRGLALLHRIELPGCALMRIRTLVRLEQFDRAVLEYERRDISSYPHREGVQIAGCIAVSYANRGQLDELRKTKEVLKRITCGSSDVIVHVFAESVQALCAFTTLDHEASQRSIGKAWTMLGDRSGGWPQTLYDLDVSAIKAVLYGTEAALMGAQGQFLAQAELSLKSAVVASEIFFDRAHEAIFLRNLGNLIVRLPFKKAHDYLIARGNSFPWASATISIEAFLRSQLELSTLVFGFSNDGVIFGGRTAATLEFRLKACVDRLLRIGYLDSHEFLRELRFCVALALEIHGADGFSRTPWPLVKLAALIAPFDLGLARKALEIKETLESKASRGWFYFQELHSRAALCFAQGCIAKAEGSFEEAIDHLGLVIRLLDGPIEPIAVIAGVERFTLTRSVSDLALAEAFTTEYPMSSFAQRLRLALSAIRDAAPGHFPYLGMYGRSASQEDAVSL